MATTSKVLFRGAASTSSATLYTTPSATTTVVTNIAIANTTAYIDLKQVLDATDTIKGLASATTVDFHISGVEIA